MGTEVLVVPDEELEGFSEFILWALKTYTGLTNEDGYEVETPPGVSKRMYKHLIMWAGENLEYCGRDNDE